MPEDANHLDERSPHLATVADAEADLLADLGPTEAPDLSALNYDEWTELCADIEEWLAREVRGRG